MAPHGTTAAMDDAQLELARRVHGVPLPQDRASAAYGAQEAVGREVEDDA